MADIKNLADISNNNPAYRPDIDGLRAVAVIAVVIFHAWPETLPSGFVGVDVFFVISGFLISSILFKGVSRGTFSIKEFYARRIKRIFPALLLVLVCSLCFGWFALQPDEYRMLGRHVASAAVFVSNITLLRESGYFDAASELKPLRHLWSLGIEEQFYIVWPLFIYLAVRLRINLLSVTVLLGILSFVLNIAGIDGRFVQTFFQPHTRFWELLIGAVLAYVTFYSAELFESIRQKFADLMAITGLLLIVAALFLLDNSKLFPGWWALLPTMGTVFLISAGPQAWINRNILALRPLVFVGLISYPLYLWHWPLLSFLQIIESSQPPRSLVVVAVFLSFLLAWLTYLLVEKRIRHHPSSWVVAALVLTLVLLGLVGRFLEKQRGLPGRLSPPNLKEYEAQIKRENATDLACLEYAGQRGKVLFDYCRASNLQAKRWVAIIGDSHAHVLFRGFSEELAKKGYGTIVMANSSCPPFIGTATGKTEAEIELCSARIEQMLNIVHSEKRIEKVLMVTRGPVYITGNGFGPAEKELTNMYITSMVSHESHATPDQIFFDGLNRSMSSIIGSGKDAFYLLENPEMGVLPNSFLERPLTITNRRHECSVDFGVYESRMRGYRSGVAALKDGLPTLRVLDQQPLFCDGHDCRAVINDRLLYADDDHLSVQGSRFVAAHFVPTMTSELPTADIGRYVAN